jgi:hypothetical protein
MTDKPTNPDHKYEKQTDEEVIAAMPPHVQANYSASMLMRRRLMPSKDGLIPKVGLQ